MNMLRDVIVLDNSIACHVPCIKTSTSLSWYIFKGTFFRVLSGFIDAIQSLKGIVSIVTAIKALQLLY